MEKLQVVEGVDGLRESLGIKSEREQFLIDVFMSEVEKNIDYRELIIGDTPVIISSFANNESLDFNERLFLIYKLGELSGTM